MTVVHKPRLSQVAKTAPAVEPDARPRLGVIEGGLDRAARIARALGTTLLITFIIT